MRRRRFLTSPLLLLAAGAFAADDYPPVVAGHAIGFPRDAGSHPAFRNEWWYITGWVQDANGNRFGVQVTFFRNRPRVAETNPSAFAPRQLLFAHTAIADPRYGKLRHDQRAARSGFGLADAAQDTTAIWIDDWSLKLIEGRYVASIAARDFQLDLRFAPSQIALLQGQEGFSRKGRSIEKAWPERGHLPHAGQGPAQDRHKLHQPEPRLQVHDGSRGPRRGHGAGCRGDRN